MATLVAKSLGYEVLEFNASDVRSKIAIVEQVSVDTYLFIYLIDWFIILCFEIYLFIYLINDRLVMLYIHKQWVQMVH